MIVSITQHALDVLTTEAAHVWKSKDLQHEGLGSWLAGLVRSELASKPPKSYPAVLVLNNGLTLTCDSGGGHDEVLVYDASYTPLNGVKVSKIASFGKSGVSYFVNASYHSTGGKSYSIVKILFPSRETETVSIGEGQANHLVKLNGNNARGMLKCEEILGDINE